MPADGTETTRRAVTRDVNEYMKTHAFVPVDFVGMRGIKLAPVFRPVLRTGTGYIVSARKEAGL